jgi:hypothetical protein
MTRVARRRRRRRLARPRRRRATDDADPAQDRQKVTLAHCRCRIEHGKKGKCKRRVLGYSCSEKRTSIPTEINSRVTCKKGQRRVIYTYQQNT